MAIEEDSKAGTALAGDRIVQPSTSDSRPVYAERALGSPSHPAAFRNLPHGFDRLGEPRRHGHLDVLGSLSGPLRERVVGQCVKRRCRRGEAIWYQGEPADFVAFVTRGKAVSAYHSPAGRTGITGFWVDGDLLGCAELSGSSTRLQTVKCLEECRFLTMSTARFFEFMKWESELADTVVQALSIRLRWVTHLVLTLETQATFQRLCSVLLALCESFGVRDVAGIRIDMHLTHDGLGAMVGVTRQFANVTLHDLQDRQAIELRRRTIIVTDLAKLRRLAFDPE